MTTMAATYRDRFFQRAWSIARDGASYLPDPAQRGIYRPKDGPPLPAQVGYIGGDYRGLVFCLLNPGIPGGGPEEDRLFKLLTDFAAAESEDHARDVFDALMLQTWRCMTGTGDDFRRPWPVYSTFVEKILSGLGLKLDHIAYMNVCHFPTVGNSVGVTRPLVEASMQRHALSLMTDLEPRAVILRYQRARDPWPNGVLPSASYVVGGISASRADVAQAIVVARSAIKSQ